MSIKSLIFWKRIFVVYSSSVNPNLPQLEMARTAGKEVYSEFALANKLCRKPIIAVCGSFGRTTCRSHDWLYAET